MCKPNFIYIHKDRERREKRKSIYIEYIYIDFLARRHRMRIISNIISVSSRGLSLPDPLNA